MHDISEIKNGNKEFFKKFFHDYYPVLCMVASRYLKDREQCKDVAQETLLSYWEKRADFESIFQVKKFLYTVLRNKCLNIIKHTHVNESYILNQDEEKFRFENAVIQQEAYLLVHEAIQSLPAQMSKVISYSLEGLKNSEIAEKMGIAEGTVHSLKKTAYRKLREKLKGYFFLIFLYKKLEGYNDPATGLHEPEMLLNQEPKITLPPPIHNP